MPQEPCFTSSPPPTNSTSQSAEDDLDCLRNAQLEASSKPDPIQANTGSRNQEHANRGAQHETGVRTEQLLASGVADEEAITTVQTARYDEASEARFRRILQEERRERPATSSMEIADLYDDGTMSTGHTSTVTPSKRSTQNPQSYGHGHTSTVLSNTDGTSQPDMGRMDEVIEEDQISNLPPQADITLDYIFEPPTPLSIVEQAFRFADNSDRTLTDEEYSSFERQPFEAQKHTLKVFFKELAYMGLILQEQPTAKRGESSLETDSENSN